MAEQLEFELKVTKMKLQKYEIQFQSRCSGYETVIDKMKGKMNLQIEVNKQIRSKNKVLTDTILEMQRTMTDKEEEILRIKQDMGELESKHELMKEEDREK